MTWRFASVLLEATKLVEGLHFLTLFYQLTLIFLN